MAEDQAIAQGIVTLVLLRFQFVADAVHGDDAAGTGSGILFQLFPQPADMHIDHLGFAVVLRSPHLGQQVIQGHHLSRLQSEGVKQVELAR